MYEVPIFHGTVHRVSGMPVGLLRRSLFRAPRCRRSDSKRGHEGPGDAEGTRTGRRLVSARRNPGRVHGAQRHDHGHAAGRDWNDIADDHGGQFVARRAHERLLRPPGELPLPAASGQFQVRRQRRPVVDVRAAGGRRDWRDWAHGHGFSDGSTTRKPIRTTFLRDKALVKLVLNSREDSR